MRGLIYPFQRDLQRDFAAGEGLELIRSKVLQVLMTEGKTPFSEGELPWRTEFGASLGLLRHQKNDDILDALAETYIRDALAEWVPEIRLMGVKALRSGPRLTLQISFEVRETRQTSAVELSP